MKIQWVGLGLVAMVACSSSESSTSTPPATTPTPDGGTTPAGTPMTVWVYEQNDDPSQDPKPLAGATVAVDPPDGAERVELTTEADGHAVVNADFTKGPAVVTAVAPGHIVVTALEASPDQNKTLPENPFGHPSSDLHLVLEHNAKAQAARSVELSGNLTGKADPGNVVGIGSTGVFESYIFPGDTYAARVPKSRPFSLLCFEGPVEDVSVPRTFDRASLRLFRVDRPAVDANGTFDIDVSQGTLASSVLHWKVEITGGDTGPLGGTSSAFANVASIDSGAATGFFRHIEPTADKTAFDVELHVAQTDLAPEVVRSFAILQNTDGSFSLRQEPGTAPDGTVFKDFLLPPAVAVTKQTRADAFAIDGVSADTESVSINLFAGRDIEWVVLGPFKKKPSGPIKLPALPSTATEVASILKAQIVAFADFVEVPGRKKMFIARKVAMSRGIVVNK